MQTSLFSYNLPRELIAQTPKNHRDQARLFVYNKKNKTVKHDIFCHLKNYLQPGDVLVFNNTKVLPARLIMYKPTGGKVEIFLLKDLGGGKWECLLKNTGKNFKFLILNFKTILNFKCQILKRLKNGNFIIKFNYIGKKFLNFLEKYGVTPLPPYIKTGDSKKIRTAYQTVYAKDWGSVAAPTAGLHFTKKLIRQLKNYGVQTEFVTLHVGQGTFQPVKTKKIIDHKMHPEWISVDKNTAQKLNLAKKNKQKILAVGTTVVRTLEAATNNRGHLRAINKPINIFIYPSYKFKFVDALITNFHLPQSTLIMLVAAFLSQGKNKTYGIKKIKELYNLAIKKKYRFYSFGDAMLIQ
ncbi:MAG TPA: tRNA preQ1(34) S-adenosylmethionine ribosyltransferase-isomerase QueA [bacterium]|nr:tRNA preQ1(34) S-adenosylmethionine ribosyltransferase-isomerase QueA [bacterium]HPL95409.1 tRNA preQ1(34) S-adenosylmethionine ribosyltransferase-isomerase QueA [bacterium]